MAQDRFRLTPEGQVVLRLRHPWSDGTTHLVFDPVELLERLAVLTLRQAQGHPEQRRGMIPRPRINLILYHGVLPFDVAPGAPFTRNVFLSELRENRVRADPRFLRVPIAFQ